MDWPSGSRSEWLLYRPGFIWRILGGKKNFNLLPSKNKVDDENLHFQRRTNFLVKSQFSVFSSDTLFLEGNQLNFYSPKHFVKWKQVKTTNMILQRPELLSRFDLEISSYFGGLLRIYELLTEAGAYPQLPTQPKFFWSFSNLYSNLLWSFWVVSRRKNQNLKVRKKIQFITESCIFMAETPANFPF